MHVCMNVCTYIRAQRRKKEDREQRLPLSLLTSLARALWPYDRRHLCVQNRQEMKQKIINNKNTKVRE